MEVPIDEASNGSIKLELNPIATQLPIHAFSNAPASNFIFLAISTLYSKYFSHSSLAFSALI